jgi:hypothetical protein
MESSLCRRKRNFSLLDFDLFLQRDLLIALLFFIEETECHLAESPNGVICVPRSLFSEATRISGSLAFSSLFEDERECFQPVFVMQQFRFHAMTKVGS